MKMNYLSDGKKSILGKRLSSRYLSSDAFTSSAGKTGGRSISQLGSLFGRKKSFSKRFGGVGQRIGLFEFKNIFLKFLFAVVCLIIIGYAVPFFRYATHGFFVQTFNKTPSGMDENNDTADVLQEGEIYVAPVFGKTDRFVVNVEKDVYPNGSLVYDVTKRTVMGIFTQEDNTPQVILLSEVGQRNHLFIKGYVSQKTTESTVEPSTSSDVGVDSDTSSSTVSTTTSVFNLGTVLFEGFGYGQLRAQVPPQEEIPVDTVLYMRTVTGLVPVAQVNHIEKDSGSTFTNIYAQLLVAPFELYKIRIID